MNPATISEVKDLLTNAMMSIMGVDKMTYIKPVMTEKGPGFAVFTADGTQLAVFPTQEAAFYSARKHNLTPVHLH